MIFEQMLDSESFTLTYLLADEKTHEAILIDPVIENLSRDLALLDDLALNLKYTLETHVHADHLTSALELHNKTGAEMVIGSQSGAKYANVLISDNQILNFGNLAVKALHTPGHTSACISYLVNDCVFSGDVLFIGGCGRTDFQDGDSKTLYNSVYEKLFSLADHYRIYPGHDYNGNKVTTILEQKNQNPRLKLGISQGDFCKIMSDLNLPFPKKMDIAVPANLMGGKI